MEDYFEHHTKVHEILYRCEVCEKQYKSKRGLELHAINHSDKKLKCNLCEKSFVTKLQLNDHMATHTGIDNYHCPQCSLGFKHKTNWYRHMKTCQNKLTVMCSFCSKVFATNEYLKQHIRMKHENEGLEVTMCHRCGATFKWKVSLYRHRCKAANDEAEDEDAACTKPPAQY